MKINFFKFHGTGNDFIIINDDNYKINENTKFLKKLCNRRTGIGSDGLILIKKYKDSKYNFYMKYYNSNGIESTMCGNGGRCAVYFSNMLGITNSNKVIFKTIDGVHKGLIHKKNNNIISINIISINNKNIKIFPKYVFLFTGSPHHIVFLNKEEHINIYKEGKRIRSSYKYGTNVNFVKIYKNYLYVRTYERGIENETLSCGTGVVASVIASVETKKISKKNNIEVITLGGKLLVSFEKRNNIYENIYLTGPVKFVFKGLFFY
ncbi:diaminopimelate epimerase [Blattabacterium cuenoti]|uniref:diaminopimelate epimerase n=1 Tax=Blattabacterium cuenoti TaxID=1653831 RepID=UPI00163B6873|nr:diaminopimelate epimerase [Blattabacterium cuenoti]